MCIRDSNLGPQDSHLVQAIRQSAPQTLAISIYPRSAAFIQHQKRHYAKLFEGLDLSLRFFDSKTHALGNPALSVPVER